ncbi:hypothetical protein PAMA_018359 [Pampus argenteus]
MGQKNYKRVTEATMCIRKNILRVWQRKRATVGLSQLHCKGTGCQIACTLAVVHCVRGGRSSVKAAESQRCDLTLAPDLYPMGMKLSGRTPRPT